MDLKEIAKQSGVSTATVSRVLNDQPGVSPEVREKVLRAAAEANYRPNPLARSLATSKTQTVGFVVHKEKYAFSDDPFYPLILSGVEDYLTQNDIIFSSPCWMRRRNSSKTAHHRSTSGGWIDPGRSFHSGVLDHERCQYGHFVFWWIMFYRNIRSIAC
jgi:transcriptional regulator with XRE-family HTH domain